MKITAPGKKSSRALHNAMWASPDFSRILFEGSEPKSGFEPSRALYKLIGSLMPQYFDVLGARYGVDGLLAESNGVLDVAFMIASWRYTKIIGVEAYRCGLHSWPPEAGWEERSLCAAKLTAPVDTAASTHRKTASSHDRAGAAQSSKGRSAPTSSSVGGAGRIDGKVANEWEIALDGNPVRTEAGFRSELHRHKYIVKPSSTHGVNNCLIDSLILALSHAGLAREVCSLDSRAMICQKARRHLVDQHGASEDDYLAHDDHLKNIFEYLRSHERDFWHEDVSVDLLECTVTVFDRFTCRMELVPTEPVFMPALVAPASSQEVRHVQLALYACTVRDGQGYHYEWIHGIA